MMDKVYSFRSLVKLKVSTDLAFDICDLISHSPQLSEGIILVNMGKKLKLGEARCKEHTMEISKITMHPLHCDFSKVT
jgi:hypothetical protein